MRGLCYQPDRDGLLLFVRLTPNAARDEVLGVDEGADGPVLKTKVRAIPDKGRANKAVTELIADWLGVPKSDVSLKTGGKSRTKTLSVAGDDRELTERLEQQLAKL